MLLFINSAIIFCMLITSSKRLIKNKNKKIAQNNNTFHFLLNSRELEKQNQNDNISKALHRSSQFIKGSLKNSIQNMHPLQKSYQQINKINLKGKHHSFFQNVKFLKDSRVQIKLQKSKQKQTNYKKNIQLSKKSAKNWESQKIYRGTEQKFSKEMTSYICMVNDILQDLIPQNLTKNLQKKIKVVKQFGDRLVNKLQNQKQIDLETNFKHIQPFQTDQNMDYMKEVNAEYIKVIGNLQAEKQKLQNLLFQHESTNIKMFMQINHQQSEEMQIIKDHLTSLFNKYKQLEKVILNSKKTTQQANSEMQKLKNQNIQLKKDLQKFQKQNQQLKNQNKKIKIEVHALLEEIQIFKNQKQNTSFFEPLEQKQNKKGGSVREMDKDSQSQILSCSTLNKNKFKKKNSIKQTIGVNLKDKFTKQQQQSIKDYQNIFNQLKKCKQNLNMETVEKLAIKKEVQKNKQKIYKMEGIIREQNSELQKSLERIQNLQKKIQKQALQNNLQKQIKSEKKQALKISKLFQWKDLDKGKLDQIRIIAMQAKILENSIKN